MTDLAKTLAQQLADCERENEALGHGRTGWPEVLALQQRLAECERELLLERRKPRAQKFGKTAEEWWEIAIAAEQRAKESEQWAIAAEKCLVSCEREQQRLEEFRQQIADPSYVGSYSDAEVVAIYRRWALAASPSPEEVEGA